MKKIGKLWFEYFAIKRCHLFLEQKIKNVIKKFCVYLQDFKNICLSLKVQDNTTWRQQ